MKYITRHLEKHIKECIEQYECTVVTGPRQVGKSTTIEHSILKFHKFNVVRLDNKKDIDFANSDPIEFFRQHQIPLCIDEVQKAPLLFGYIKEIIDKYKKQSLFLLTGSESFELMKGVSDSLSTRTSIIELQSLSNSEINNMSNFVFEPNIKLIVKRKTKIKTQYEIFKNIIRGSMPDIINGKKTNNTTYYDAYIKTTLIRDLKEDLIKIVNLNKFLIFLKILASQVGQHVNPNSISKLAKIDQKTSANWINALVAMGIIFFIHPYSNSAITRTTRLPKLYFYDLGLVCHLTEYDDATSLMHSDFSGHVFECYVVSEIAKGFINDGRHPKLFYLKNVDRTNKDTGEIDLIVEGKNGYIYPIEIKKTSTPDIKFFRAINLLKNIKDKKIGPMSLICTAETFSTFGKDKLVIPIHWI